MVRLAGPALILALFLGACGGDGGEEATADAPSPFVVPSATEPPDPETPEEAGRTEGEVPVSEDAVPDFRVETFDDGVFVLSESFGTPIVLNFWESW